MKNGVLFFLFSVLSSFSLFGASGDTARGLKPAEKDTVKSYMKPFPTGVQCALAVIDSSRARFYGVKKGAKGFKGLNNRDSVFRIGSLSKVFTAHLLAKFVHQRRLALHDTIWGGLGLTPELDTAITFQQLATHTSGLPRIPSGLALTPGYEPNNPYKGYDAEVLEEYVRKRMQLKGAPGEAYQYSNLGYGLLGYVLEKLSGRSYGELIQKHVAVPYGMEQTGSSLQEFRRKAVSGLDKKGEPTPYWNFGALKGCGALFSTVKDLSRYVRAQFDTTDAVLSLQQKVIRSLNKGKDMALGWHVLKKDGGRRWHWHNGGTQGFKSSLVMDLDQKEAAIVLANISALHESSDNIDSISFTLLRNL